MKPIPVLLAEDQASFRKSLKMLVEMEGDIEVIGQAKNGREAVDLSKRLQPEVIVMDIAMPVLNGLQATRAIMEKSPNIRVLILSANPDPEYVRQAVLWGASGYLLKQSSTPVLAHAVREVQKGKSYFSTVIAKDLRDQCQKLFSKSELQKKKSVRQGGAKRSRGKSESSL